MQIKLLQVREASGEYITDPVEIHQSMKNEALADRECFWVLHLNTKKRVIEKELVAMGTGNLAVITPREVFRKAILNGATTIATVHNHPSNDCNPSNVDKEVWERLNKAGELLGIKVIDNLIISSSGYYSERENK